MISLKRGVLAAVTITSLVAGCGSIAPRGDGSSPNDAGTGIDARPDAPDAAPSRDASVPDAAPDPHGNCGSVAIVCDGLCVDPTTDRNNCGGCGSVCPFGCDLGKCECAPYAACGDVCVDLKTDRFNCGACDHSCNGGDCRDGVCSQCTDSGICPPCPYDWETYCGGQCVVAELDTNNCGACGVACHAGAGETPYCLSSACGRIGELATAQASPVGIAIDDTYVYWWTKTGAILRTPKGNVGGGLPSTVLDPGNAIGSIVMTKDAIVFTTPSANAIGLVAKDGTQHASPVVLVQNEVIASNATVAVDRAYWSTGTTIRSVSLSGGAASTFVDAAAPVPFVASDGSATLYWFQRSDLVEDRGIFVASVGTAPSAPRLFVDVQSPNIYTSLSVSNGDPCLTFPGPFADPRLGRFDQSATWTSVGTYLGPAGEPSNIAFDGASLAWVDDDTVYVRVFDPNAAGTAVYREPHTYNGPTTIAMDAEYLYVAREKSSSIRRIAR